VIPESTEAWSEVGKAMCEYYSRTVIQPKIPYADLTMLEQSVLGELFRFREDSTGTHFFSDDMIRSAFYMNITDLRETMASADGAGAIEANRIIKACLINISAVAGDVWLEFPERFWEAILQDIVKRSKTLRYISVTTSFFCRETRDDSPGAEVTLITADGIWSRSTDEMLLSLLDGARVSPSRVGRPAPDDCHSPLPSVFA